MLIIAQHKVHDPEGFWNAAKEATQNLPGSLKVHAVYPSADGKTGTCIWEADSVKEVQDFLDEKASPFADNFCYEVNTQASIGLPDFRSQAAMAN